MAQQAARQRRGITCRVEWTSTLVPPGNTNWATFQEFDVTNLFMQADVPMFYRVVGIPAEPVTNATLYANQHCLTTGIGGPGENTNRFVNVVTGVGGDYAINVVLNSVHIGGDTTQICLCTPKGPAGTTGFAYYVLEPGDNAITCQNGEFSLFFVDQTSLGDNSGSATVTFSGAASTQTVLQANQHCITTGIGGPGDSTNRVVNIVTGVGGDYMFDVSFNSVHQKHAAVATQRDAPKHHLSPTRSPRNNSFPGQEGFSPRADSKHIQTAPHSMDTGEDVSTER